MTEINNVKTNKATQITDIPTKLIKENSDIFGHFIFGNYDNCVSYCIFPSSLKIVIMTPVYKKAAKTSKDNYRPVSILSSISEIYERLMFRQVSEYFGPSYQNFSVVLEKDLVLNPVY